MLTFTELRDTEIIEMPDEGFKNLKEDSGNR
jgi:hypothetical protein